MGLVAETSRIIIEDNNPDRLFILIAIVGVAFILTMLVCMSANKKRMKELKKTRRKIEKRHQLIQYENEKRELMKKNGKESRPKAVWKELPF